MGELTDYARSVLDLVALIPRGKVMTYGDVAEYLGSGSARTVGMVLGRYGSEVPWQRVVPASGRPAPRIKERALVLLKEEGCPLRGDRVILPEARWDGRSG